MSIRTLALACLSMAHGSRRVPAGLADTTITVLHVSDDAATRPCGTDRQDYNAAHKGVTVQFKYFENEAFKAKLPTMLQSRSRGRRCTTLGRRRDGGAGQGRLPERHQVGGRGDTVKTLSPTAVAASRWTARRSACRSITGAVPFFYNKDLLAKAGVKPEDIKSWDGFLGGSRS